MEEILLAMAIGFAGGVAAGLLGVGGGAVFIPGIVLLLDRPQDLAHGVSLTVIVVTAATGVLQHARHHNVDFRAAGWMIPAAVALGATSATLATFLDPEVLRRVFGGVALIAALQFLAQPILRSGWVKRRKRST